MNCLLSSLHYFPFTWKEGLVVVFAFFFFFFNLVGLF